MPYFYNLLTCNFPPLNLKKQSPNAYRYVKLRKLMSAAGIYSRTIELTNRMSKID